MSVKNEEKKLLQEVKDLNNLDQFSEYNKVMRLLKLDVLERFNNSNLYAQRAKAAYGLRKDKSCLISIKQALKINKDNFLANYLLANILIIDGEFSDAKTRFEKIIETHGNTEDLEKFITSSFCNIGLIHRKQREYKTAFFYYEKALENNPIHICANNGIGNLYFEISQFDKAKEHYEIAILNDPRSAEAYSGLGAILYHQGKLDRAESYFLKSIRFEKDYTDSLNYLGHIFSIRKEYDKAIKYYKKAIKSDVKHFNSYNGVGIALKKQGKLKESLEYFDKLIRKAKTISTFYFNRGEVNCDLGYFESAKDDFENCIKYSDNEKGTRHLSSQSKIEEIDSILKNQAVTNLSKIINEIRKFLIFDGNNVVHYTSLSTMRALIADNSPFRLSEGGFMNDTSEGDALYNFVGIRKQFENSKPQQFIKQPFIGSFVSDLNYDDLNHWRMYGKENNNEATGCSFTINTDLLISQMTIIDHQEDDQKKSANEELAFFRIAYINEQSNSFNIPGLTKRKINQFNKLMKEFFNEFSTFAKRKLKGKNEIDDIVKLLSEIRYLFKSSIYEHESELRLLISDTFREKKTSIIDTLPRVYIELAPLRKCISKVTLGPKVERAEEWAALFFYNMQGEKLGDKIYISKQPFK